MRASGILVFLAIYQQSLRILRCGRYRRFPLPLEVVRGLFVDGQVGMMQAKERGIAMENDWAGSQGVEAGELCICGEGCTMNGFPLES